MSPTGSIMSPTGSIILAQGNALGCGREGNRRLKACFIKQRMPPGMRQAFSLRIMGVARLPRALPWASMGEPVGLGDEGTGLGDRAVGLGDEGTGLAEAWSLLDPVGLGISAI